MVFNHFTELVSKKCLISAQFGDRDTAFLTTIVNLDKENQVVSLDCAPSAALDQQLLSSAKVLFRTEVDGIKVSFSGKGIKKIKHGNDWVLSMPIPNAIFWMQRRQYYRVKIPLSHTQSFCRLTMRNGDTTETETFRLYDLSIAGISFLNQNPKWCEQLQPNREFTDCTLHLHNGNRISIGFMIKNNVKLHANTANIEDKIGCLLHPLAPSFEAIVQRYMQEIELQQKNIG